MKITKILDLGVNLYRGEFVMGANCPGVNCLGANCLRGQLSPGPIVSGWICIGVNCLRGQLTGANCPGVNCLGVYCPDTMYAPPVLPNISWCKERHYNSNWRFVRWYRLLSSPRRSASYLCQKDSASSMYSEMDIRIHSLIENLRVNEQRLELFMEATKDDLVLQRVISYASKGWPGYKSDCNLSVQFVITG